MVSIAERIGAPIGATTCPLRVTATTHTAVLEIAVTIQPMSGSATTDSGGTTDSLTLRGGHVWDATYHQAQLLVGKRDRARFHLAVALSFAPSPASNRFR